MFIVSWLQEGLLNSRVYSKREYAEKLASWCKLNKFQYNFAEETVDREILAYDVLAVNGGKEKDCGNCYNSYYEGNEHNELICSLEKCKCTNKDDE